jgi:hypothetical protein
MPARALARTRIPTWAARTSPSAPTVTNAATLSVSKSSISLQPRRRLRLLNLRCTGQLQIFEQARLRPLVVAIAEFRQVERLAKSVPVSWAWRKIFNL